MSKGVFTPDFPRANSERSLTTQQPSFLAPADTKGQVLEQVGKVGATAYEFGEKWLGSLRKMRNTQADVNQKLLHADIEGRASVDTDYNAFDKYKKETDKAFMESSKGIRDPEALSKLNLERNLLNIKLDNIFRKKQMEHHQVNIKTKIDTIVSNPTKASLEEIKGLLASNSEFFTEDESYGLIKNANDDLGVNRINKDLYSAKNLEEVDAIRENILSGVYEEGGVVIPPDKKKNLLEISDRARTNLEKKLEAQRIEAMSKNRVDTITGIATGQINPETINITEISEFDPQLGLALSKAKEFLSNYDPKIPKEEQYVSMAGVVSPSKLLEARNYANSVSDVFDQTNNERLGEFVLREFEKKGDGNTSSVKLAAFMRLAALKYKANNPKTSEDEKDYSQLNSIKSAIKFLQTANPYLSSRLVEDFVVKNFLTNSVDQETVMAEAKSVLKDKILDRYKSVAGLPALPNKIVDGESSVEDLHSGLNELDGEVYSGDYGDQNSRE